MHQDARHPPTSNPPPRPDQVVGGSPVRVGARRATLRRGVQYQPGFTTTLFVASGSWMRVTRGILGLRTHGRTATMPPASSSRNAFVTVLLLRIIARRSCLCVMRPCSRKKSSAHRARSDNGADTTGACSSPYRYPQSSASVMVRPPLEPSRHPARIGTPSTPHVWPSRPPHASHIS